MHPRRCLAALGLIGILCCALWMVTNTKNDVDISESGISGLPLIYSNQYGLYTTPQGKPIIWVYWDKPTLPAFIKISLQALRCHNEHFAHVELVDDEKFAKLLEHHNLRLHPTFPLLSVNHKADYFRGMILLIFGGFYTDADVLAWGSLEPWFETLKAGFDVFGYTNLDEIVGPTFLGPMRANNSFIRQWSRDAHALLDKKFADFNKTGGDPLDWDGLALQLLTSAMRQQLKEKKIRYKSVNGVLTFDLIARTGLQEQLWLQFNPRNETQMRGIDVLRYSDFPLFYYFDDHDNRYFKMTEIDKFLEANSTLGELLKMSIARSGCKDGLFSRSS